MLSLPGPRQAWGERQAECGALQEKGRTREEKTKSKGRAARHTEKQSATARPVFTLWQRCEDMKHGSGVLWQAPLLFIPVSDKENKAPACFLHSLFACRRHKAAGWPARDSHPAHLAGIFVDRKLVWLSGRFLWLPTPQRSGTGGERVELVDAPSAQTCTHGREQNGLLGPKAGERAPERPARVITPAARARVCICAHRGQ